MGLYGKALEEAIKSTGDEIELLVDGLIAKQSVTQFFAGDGIGKSTLILQAELEASAGVPVYGEYEVKKPLRVLHIQTERHPIEAYQRMVMMMQKIPVNFDNFYFEFTLQGYDLTIMQDRLAIMDKLKAVREEFGEIDWCHIDPIYAWISKDMTGDAGAGCINDMIRKIQKDVCQTVSYNHHPNRGIKDKDTGERTGEDMYGNRFISANCTGVFHIKGKKDKTGTIWENNKDSYSCLTRKFELEYEPQHYMSYVDAEKTFVSKADRMLSFIKVCKAKNKAFSFEDLMTQTNVSTAYARRQISRYIEIGHISVSNPSDKKYLYTSHIG